MPKIRISLKGTHLYTVELGLDKTGIGSDPSNKVHIDGSTVTDFHAEIYSSSDGFCVRPLKVGFPIVVNEEFVTTKHLLQNGDRVLIGKHHIDFQDEPAKKAGKSSSSPPKEEPIPQFRSFQGSFQVMNGKQLGVVIPLKTGVTQIGKEATGMVIVTRVNEGYLISAGSQNVKLTINGFVPENEKTMLSDGDIVRVNNSLLLFFQR